MHSKGGVRQEEWEREGQNSGEQRHEICGRVRGGEHEVNKMDTTVTSRKESREFEGGRFVVD